MLTVCQEKLSTKPNIYVIHQRFSHFADVIGSVFVVTILRTIGEIAFISANFDVGVSCSSIFMFKSIVYDQLFIQDLNKSCGMEMYRVEKSKVRMKVALRTPK